MKITYNTTCLCLYKEQMKYSIMEICTVNEDTHFLK